MCKFWDPYSVFAVFGNVEAQNACALELECEIFSGVKQFLPTV